MKKSLLWILPAALVACGSPAPETTETATPEVAAPAEPDYLAVPAGARVFFVNLTDGQVLKSPVVVEMGVEGMGIEPAGALKEGTGHHHIIINGTTIVKGETVPADAMNIHYGKGQTSDTLVMEPGNYTLTLQFANGFHQSYGDQMSATINVTVQ
jgi:hypothetical protein